MNKYDVKFNDDKTVTITLDFYGELFDDQQLLEALKAQGVDNWDGWDFAVQSLNEDEDRLNDVLGVK